MGALEDLKALVMEGYLEKVVDLKVKDQTFKIKIRTLTMLEEIKALNDAGLKDLPTNLTEHYQYICAVIPYVVKEINGEAVKPETLKEFINLFPGELIAQIYEAYKALNVRELKAGEELKNS